MIKQCTECLAPVYSKSGLKMVCGKQSEPDTCAWKKQRRMALKYYYDNKKEPECKLKTKATKRKYSEESDWCDYSSRY